MSVSVLWIQLTAAVQGQSPPMDGGSLAEPLAQGTLAQNGATPPPPSAPVILDGRPIFAVANTQQVTSQERADYISEELAALVQRQDAFQVDWVRREEVPVIL
ncbi:MAG: mechanosensitive ion channel protein MscS, partial [Cyanobacteria bacterium]|nr:mechanosensitive ion channel protein MscS [Cyanobacteriota bacterium]